MLQEAISVFFLIIVNVSSTNFLHIFGGVVDVLIALISRSSMNKLATIGLMGDPIATPSFLFIEFTIEFKIGVLEAEL